MAARIPLPAFRAWFRGQSLATTPAENISAFIVGTTKDASIDVKRRAYLAFAFSAIDTCVTTHLDQLLGVGGETCSLSALQ